MAEYRINYTQSNFTGGIIAAELYGRNDFNKVKSGLKKCTNWTIREAGGLEFRRGTKYLSTLPVAAGTNFKMASLDDVLVFFCNDGIRYIDSNSWQDGSVYETTFYFWQNGSHEDRYCYTMSRTPSVGDTIYYDLSDLTKTGIVTAYDSGNDTISFSYDGNNWNATYAYSVSDNGWVLLPYPTGIVPNLSKLHFTELKRRLYYYDGSMKLCEVVLNNGVPSTSITRFESAPSGASISSEVQGTLPDVYVLVDHTYSFSLAKDSEHESTVFDGSTTQNTNAELTRANSSDNKGVQVNVTITLSADQMQEYADGKAYIYKKYQGVFYFLDAIDVSKFNSSTRAYTYQDVGQVQIDMSKTSKEKPYYLNSDGTVDAVNSIADYNQRLFLTRTNDVITEIIFSQVGSTDTLAYSTQRGESEAGHLELPISNYDSWCKVTAGLDLILSTSYTISKVSGYGDLTTDTILWDGLSKDVEPVRTRRSVIYTNTSNRNIYDLTYNEYGQYDSIDLTLLIKYVFEEKTIKRLAFKDYPVKTIYVLCDDGELYCLTYIKDQNIYAWYKIEHSGLIYDVCVVNTDTEDEVYLVVNYDGTYVLEQAYHRTDAVYLDCTVLKKQTEFSGNVISGLDVFEGKSVRVFDLGNNLYYGDYDIQNPKHVVEGGKTVEIDDLDFDGFVVTNGQITIPEDVVLVGNVLVGLPYYAVMETIPLEFSDQNGNSTIGRKKAVNEAYLRYGDSRGLTYKTQGHEYDCGICERDIADDAQFLERGQVKLHTLSEYKWDSTIKILQRQPYPARIESITLGITFNDKS